MQTSLPKVKLLFYFLVLYLLIGGGMVCVGYDDQIMSPVQMLAKSTLTKAVVLDNSSDIYVKIAELFDQQGIVKSRMPNITSADVNLAWLSNPVADKETYRFVLPKDSSILDALQEVAKKRKEMICENQNFIVIKPPGTKAFRSSYRRDTKKKGDAPASLDRLVNAVMLTQISLREPEGEPMEDFVNAKLKGSAALSTKSGNGNNFVFTLSDRAKNAVAKVNLIGTWTYQDLLDAIGELTGLHWGIDGNILRLGINERTSQPGIEKEPAQ